MSELTAYNSERIYWAVEQVKQEAGDIEDLHLDDNLFYLKSEADKVIAQLKDKARHYPMLVLIIEDAKRDLLRQAKEIRYHKYKQCLAMAWWCASRSASWCFDPADEQLHKSEFYDKWKHRWLELAEKFKEARCRNFAENKSVE